MGAARKKPYETSMIESLLADFSRATGLHVRLYDTSGDFMPGNGRSTVCEQYHCTHPVARERCRRSIERIYNRVRAQPEPRMERCGNGLWMIAVPLDISDNGDVVLLGGGARLAEEAAAAEEFIDEQVRELGYDEAGYRRLFTSSPCMTRGELEALAATFAGFAGLLKRFASYRDASEEALRKHRRTERRLRESERKYEMLVKNVPVGVVIMQNGRIMFASEQYFELLGYTAGDMLEMNAESLRNMLHPEDAERLWAEYEATERGDREFHRIEGRILHRNGGVRHGIIYGSRIEYNGKPAVQLTYEDITEYREAIERLRESERRFRLFAENSEDTCVFHDMEGKIVYFSGPAARQGDIDQTWFLGKSPADLYPREEARPVLDQLREVRETGRTLVTENRVTWQGHDVWCLDYIYPLIGDDGGVVGTAKLSRNITKNKELELRLQHSAKENETLVREIHHRVKNNLQVVASFLDLQAEKGVGDVCRDQLRDSINRIRAMAQIHDILNKADSMQRVDLEQYLRSICSSVVDSYGADRLQVRLEYDVEPVQLSMEHAVPCGLVVNEIVSNACKFAFPDDSPGTIHIRVDERENNRVHMEIGDDGAGFPDGFDWRDTESLGLKITRLLIERQLQGSIRLKPGKGVRYDIAFQR